MSRGHASSRQQEKLAIAEDRAGQQVLHAAEQAARKDIGRKVECLCCGHETLCRGAFRGGSSVKVKGVCEKCGADVSAKASLKRTVEGKGYEPVGGGGGSGRSDLPYGQGGGGD